MIVVTNDKIKTTLIISKVSLNALISIETDLSLNKSAAIEQNDNVILQITTSIIAGKKTRETLIIPTIPTDDLTSDE